MELHTVISFTAFLISICTLNAGHHQKQSHMNVLIIADDLKLISSVFAEDPENFL